ncbi:DUF6316 family protein [Pseudomonas putida]|jgi:hypothetical protein|uniref:DUF6316 family protein n=1 Tax=Pseudomonas putida TaxID=303 RepID=UPI0023648925|nr:DUF6316 family protein [Pseudomonas putida]MDD2054904.1 DUF6316 family protein [Pseudomonas putida]
MFGMRSSDTAPATHFRSDRISSVNGQYYFTTRENTLEGPFLSRSETQREIDAYLRRTPAARH